MEGRATRGRGGSWKRGGRGGNDSESFGGEHRGRGRGGQHRGRGRRDHHRGRGRGGGAHAADFHQRDQDEGVKFEEEDDRVEVFARRKLQSNWDRYEESERQEPDDGTPAQRGADYHVLLQSAGDSFSQFRFSEEKDWEMDPFTSQMSAVFVDLSALAQTLQQVPLHQRLNLEAELVQVSTPVELPAVPLAPKPDVPKTFTPPSAAFRNLCADRKAPAAATPAAGSDSRVSSVPPKSPEDDGDEELEQLLGLRKPASDVSGADEQSAAPEKACEEAKEPVPTATEEEAEEAKDEDVAPPKSSSVRQELTEDDLEDWLDSMIS